MFCTYVLNLVILAWTADELSCGQASDWYTHRHTHTDRYTDRGDDNTRRPKLASGKKYTHIYHVWVRLTLSSIFQSRSITNGVRAIHNLGVRPKMFRDIRKRTDIIILCIYVDTTIHRLSILLAPCGINPPVTSQRASNRRLLGFCIRQRSRPWHFVVVARFCMWPGSVRMHLQCYFTIMRLPQCGYSLILRDESKLTKRIRYELVTYHSKINQKTIVCIFLWGMLQ